MTLNALIKKLQKFQKKGAGRMTVSIDKPTFWDGNGTFAACAVKGVRKDEVLVDDGDGVPHIDYELTTKWMIVLEGCEALK